MKQYLTREVIAEVIENGIIWLAVLGMVVYGAAKILQFEGAAAIDTPVSELTGMQLMWAFYGYSKPFVLIIGALEITSGMLMFFKKTRIIGCFLASTILINIILQDFFYGVHRGALMAAVTYQICILIILWIHRQRILITFKSLLIPRNITRSNQQLFIILLLSFLLLIVLRILEYFSMTLV